MEYKCKVIGIVKTIQSLNKFDGLYKRICEDEVAKFVDECNKANDWDVKLEDVERLLILV
jgi:hypothetical protein